MRSMRILPILAALFLIAHCGWASDRENSGDMRSLDAAKMLEQAEMYLDLDTPADILNAKSLFEEIIRRYPETPQAANAEEGLKKSALKLEEWKKRDEERGIHLDKYEMYHKPYHPSPDERFVTPPGQPKITDVNDC